jgi:serine/threonine-protein kinase
MTPAGLLAGTPEYMAPEHALGKEADHRCDIYSLAMVAYEMFAGAPPFTADSPVALLLRHVNDALPDPPGDVVSAPVMRAIRKGAAKDPAARWPSATAFVDALEAAVGAEDQRTGDWRILWRTAAGVTAIVAAVTAGWLVIGAKGRATQSDPVPASLTAVPKATEPAATSTPAPSRQLEVNAPPTMPAALPQRQPMKDEAAPTPLPSIAKPVAAALPQVLPAVEAAATTDAATPSKTIRGNDNSTPVPAPARELFTAPARIRSVSPKYPPAARAAQLEGDVLLEAIVSPEGKVTNVTIVRSVHPLLDEAARAAVLLYDYEPARRNGVPEPAAVRLTVSFRMH